MRKIVFSAWITLDGRIAGPDGGYDWVLMNDEVGAYESQILIDADTLIFGRYTYTDFAAHWPRAEAALAPEDRPNSHPHRMNAALKVVISHALEDPPWGPVRLLRGIDPAEIQALKEEPGKDILIWGSASIVQQLTNLGLVDEYQLLLHPAVLGGGKQLWQNIDKRVQFSLADVHQFSNGVTKLTYVPARA
ncbi:hypothetical protein AYO38_03830 [bacterium SCGC AG-212-C10]|nr:hypothetical protein AYO38_03830 [bacterium SCGC AG-212-C10]